MRRILNSMNMTILIILITAAITFPEIYLPFQSILAIAFYSIIPGFLILQLIGDTDRSFPERTVLCIGLSIAWLYLVGGIAITLSSVIDAPLRVTPSICFIGIILMAGISLIQSSSRSLSLMPNSIPWRIFGIYLSLSLGILSGIYVLNGGGGNTILVAILIIFIFITAIIPLFNLSSSSYVVAISFIGMSLALLFGLRHSNLPVGDIQFEFYAFKKTLQTGVWNPNRAWTGNNSSMWSLTVLPTIYSHLTGWTTDVFLIWYRILVGFIPLTSYLIARQYLPSRYAFGAALFVSGQFTYITLLGSMARVEIALLGYVLFMYVLLHQDQNRFNKAYTFVFAIVTILSHYATAGLLVATVTVTMILTGHTKTRQNLSVGFAGIFGIGAFLYLWYGPLTGKPFQDLVIFGGTSVSRLSSLFTGSASTGASKGDSSVPYVLTTGIYYAIQGFLTLGILAIVVEKVRSHSIRFSWFEVVYFLLAPICIVTIFAVNFVYNAYGTGRVLLQFAPFLGIGGMYLIYIANKKTKNRGITYFVKIGFVILIITQLIAGNYLIFQLLNEPHSELLNNDGERYQRFYVTDGESAATAWAGINIKHVNRSSSIIVADFYGRQSFSNIHPRYAQQGLGVRETPIPQNKYIYLRPYNLEERVFDSKYFERRPLRDIQSTIKDRNKIYSGGNTSILTPEKNRDIL